MYVLYTDKSISIHVLNLDLNESLSATASSWKEKILTEPKSGDINIENFYLILKVIAKKHYHIYMSSLFPYMNCQESNLGIEIFLNTL